MRKMNLLAVAAVALAAFSAPAFAADDTSDKMAPAMGSEHMMMKAGETMYMMPDGTMGMMKSTDPKMAAEMMKMAKPMDHCMMMMMGSDGKMYTMDDMKMADGMMACDAMKTPMAK